MSIANKYNHGVRFDYTIPQDTPFIGLAKLYESEGEGVVYPIHGLYINRKSKYGEAPVAICDDMLVNLPKHLLDTVKQMLLDDEFVDAVNRGKVGFKIYTYTVKNNNSLLYSVNWLDI